MEGIDMPDFKIKATWIRTKDTDVLKKTFAKFLFQVGEYVLTRNVNIWDHKLEDSVIVSTYPLAKWFAYYWWRLENEFMPNLDKEISFDWRTAHEIASANNGFVWPQITLASDGEFINVYSQILSMPGQSVEYYYTFDNPQTISLPDFQQEVSNFIESTIAKAGKTDSDLKDLWGIVTEEQKDQSCRRIRQMEAALGFDPEECPEKLLKLAFDFQSQTGANSIKEVVPLLKNNPKLQEKLCDSEGIEISVDIPKKQCDPNKFLLPWQRGVNAARTLRKTLDLKNRPVTNKVIYNTLGIAESDLEKLNSDVSIPVSVGRNLSENKWSLLPRCKKFQTSQRFELSRLLGDAIVFPNSNNEWLVTSDYSSYRQKVQKAFAAEFLCPIDSLCDFLRKDFSVEKQEEASAHFNVSLQTVNSLLVNNHIIGRDGLLGFK